MVNVTNPKPTIAAIALRSIVGSHPSDRTERIPSSRYVTGFHAATVLNHQLIKSRGNMLGVKNANGKKIKKAELTAAGLPVRNATV